MTTVLHTRWVGRVPYGDALALQEALFASDDNYLLLLEHPHVYTFGINADLANVITQPEEVGAERFNIKRGGDVTYHGPGQLVGYPILTVADHARGRLGDTVAYVTRVEQLVIDACVELGLTNVGRVHKCAGVWVDPKSTAPRKIAAIGVRMDRGRTMHGFALNVDPEMEMFTHIVPCGLKDKTVTSLVGEGINVSMHEVVDAVNNHAARLFGKTNVTIDRADVAWRVVPEDLSAFTRGAGFGEPDADVGALGMTTMHKPKAVPASPAKNKSEPVRLLGRLAEVGVTEQRPIRERKPEWMRVEAEMGDDYRRLKDIMRELDLVTVCEEAGCPNIYDCWADGTATFMISGERCTRACGFCLVDTRKPEAIDTTEPARVAEAVAKMKLEFAVVTAVARDDLTDGGAGNFAATIRAIRDRSPMTQIETLISDCKGDADALQLIFNARPDVLNHNIETVARLQRAVRPSANYARSLSVLARAAAQDLRVKSGIIVGMGETDDEVFQTLVDLRNVGVNIVTIGQYLRPTTHHLPLHRWVEPETFNAYGEFGRELGFTHVESSPLTRSSYHAKAAAATV